MRFNMEAVTWGPPMLFTSGEGGAYSTLHNTGQVFHPFLPPPLTIRRATAMDLPALTLLGVALSVQHFSQFAAVADLDGLFIREQQEALVAQLGRPGTIVLLAELDSVIIGYAFGQLEQSDFALGMDGVGWVHDLYLVPPIRGTDYGPALLAAVVTALHELGAPAVLLQVAEQNIAGQRLFQRAGFRFTRREMRLDFALSV